MRAGGFGSAATAAVSLARPVGFDHHAAMGERTDRVPRRRKKVQHFDEPGDAHFLTFSCYRRMALLNKDRTRLWLVDAVDNARGKHRFDLWAWVFMPEHVHLLIWPRQDGSKTAKVLADIKRPVGQEAIGWLKKNFPWRVKQMKTTICIGVLFFAVCLIGCRKAVPISETYSVEAKQSQLVTGQKNKVEIAVRYRRSEQPAAQLKYTVQFSAPNDLTVTPTSWDVDQNLTTNDAGFNHNGIIFIEVAADAEPGDRAVTATITPTQGATSTEILKFQVAKRGG